MRLAVVGAGIGGCSAAYYASRLIPDCRVTLYEESNRVGGRLLTTTVDDTKFEVGASFYVKENRILSSLVAQLGIEGKPIDAPSSVGVWDGEKFTLRLGDSSRAARQLALRDPANTFRVLSLVRELKRKNRAIYRAVEGGAVEMGDALGEAGLYGWLRKPLGAVLSEAGVDSAFAAGVVEPVIRAIYGSDNSINAYAGLCALSTQGRTYTAAAGNAEIPRRLADASGAELRLGTRVQRVKALRDGSFEVSGWMFRRRYDAVIIANHGLRRRNPGGGGKPRRFRRVHIRVVRGKLRGSYFSPGGEAPPDLILSTRGVPFTHIARIGQGGGGSLYGIASTTPAEGLVEDAFESSEVAFAYDWGRAYPELAPLEHVPRLEAEPLLYTPGGFEFAASAMESSVLSSLSCVKLLQRRLPEVGSGRDGETVYEEESAFDPRRFVARLLGREQP